MRRIFWILLLIAGLSGCATLGRDFSGNFVQKIKIGETTRAQVEQNLGPPFRTGLDSGDATASYLFYHLGIFTNPVTKDLTLTYSPEGIVKAYTFNSNDGAEE